MLRTEWGLSEMPPPPPSFSRDKLGNKVTKPLAGQTHGNIITWGQQASSLEKRADAKIRPKNTKLHSATGPNVMDWSSSVTKDVVDKELGVKTRKNILQKSSINVNDWDKFSASVAPSRRKGGIAAPEEGESRRKFNEKNNNALYGRPSPFGIDEGKKANSGRRGSPNKKQIKSLADMI